jgi:hypothetical protein
MAINNGLVSANAPIIISSNNVLKHASLIIERSQSAVTPSGTVIYYRKRGWYASSSTYEYWNTTDPVSAAPSGHALLDVTIVASWRND